MRPGLPALHTVDEAIMARAWVQAALARGALSAEIVVITSDYHAPRASHLFGVAFGAHAGLDVASSVERVKAALTGEALAARKEHEAKALQTLRTAPFGAWLEFIKAHGVEAANRSLRWSRRLKSE